MVNHHGAHLITCLRKYQTEIFHEPHETG